ncbi:MAG: tetratricopeptide repeat protein, partial [Gemmataceae bacterium]
MRLTRILLTTIVLLCVGPPARAGLYFTDTSEPQPLTPPLNLEKFRYDYLAYYAASQSVNPTELRRHYLEKISELERRDPSTLTLNDRINLGAYYLRLDPTPEMAEKAVQALSPAEAEGRQNFQFLANLALAHHRAQRLDRAVALQQQVIDNFPDSWTGYSTKGLGWLRKCEEAYLKLLQLRYQESLRPGKPGEESVDALFPRVRFAGPEGQYSVGRIDPAQWARLPGDAGLIVQQLLLWDPSDARLYWLLGELFNANGEVVPAYGVMNDLVDARRYSPRELREHRQRLLSAINMARESAPNRSLECLAWSLLPRTATLAPGAGALLIETAPALQMANQSANPNEKSEDPGGQTARKPEVAWLPDWRTVTVSLLAVAAFALLLVLQMLEMRRRRRPEPTPAAP